MVKANHALSNSAQKNILKPGFEEKIRFFRIFKKIFLKSDSCLILVSIAIQLSTNLLLVWHQFSFLDKQIMTDISSDIYRWTGKNQDKSINETSVSSICNDWSIQSISIKSDLSIDKSIPIFIDWLLRVSIAVDVKIFGTNWDKKKKIGTLRKDDHHGSENVGKKMNLRSFKLKRVYLDPLNMSNAGDFSWSWILKDFIQVQKEEGKFVVVCSRSP